jgi:hypothetical protein
VLIYAYNNGDVRFIRMRKQIHDCNIVIFGLIIVFRMQKGAMLCYIKYMGCPPIQLINHLVY